MGADRPETFAADLHFRVQPLQYAQPKLALALHGDHPRMRQPVRGVGLEFHALFKVHKVQFHLVRRIEQCHVGYQRMKQRRFAGPGLARDEDVLRRPLTQPQ